MAADQRRKRLNDANGAGSSVCYHYKFEKKLELLKEQNAKPHISLEWDGIQSKVIARRDQVSLSKRVLRPFVNSIPQSHSHLADVFSVPWEVFGMKNLKGVISYEVWHNCLSENEKKSLLQFLPEGRNQESVVEKLLSGENFNFGNPFLEWSAKLCSGNLHPDAVIQQEECLIDDKRTYYTDIQKYHTDMIKYLQKLKETCESSKDPETEVLETIQRSRSGPKEKRSRIENGFRIHNCKDVLATTSDSLSLVEEDKACSSDNQISPLTKGRTLNKRIHHNMSKKEKNKKQLITSDDARKGEAVHKRNIYQSGGAKYMSILKISKRQLDMVKSMEESGKSIQSKSLNHLLGTINTSSVQPYEEFEKEEKKKLQEHWRQLVNMDLPAAYAKWRKGQLERGELLVSLSQEIDDKLKSSLEDEEKDNSEMVFEYQNDEGEINLEATEEGKENQMQEVRDDGEGSNREIQLMIDEDAGSSFLHEQNDQDTRNQETSIETCADTGSGSFYGMSPDHASSLRGGNYLNNDDVGSGLPHGMSSDDASSMSGGHDPNEDFVKYESIREASKSDNAPPTSEFSMNGNTAVPSVDQLPPFSSRGNLYSRNTSSGDSSMCQGASSSGGTGFVEGAENPDPSIYQGVAFSSSREIFPVDVNDADVSVGKEDPVSSSGCMYAVDVDNDPSVMQGFSVCSGGDVHPVDVDNADASISRGVPVSSPNVCLERSNNVNSSIGKGPISCGEDDWSVVNLGHSYYNSTTKEEYSSHRDGPLHHQVNGAQHTTLIDLEGERRKNVLLRHCDDSSFSSYPNPDRSGLLQSLFNGQEMSYQLEQKNTGLDFRSANDVLLQDDVFVERVQGGHLQSFIPTDSGKKTSGGNYICQNVTNEMYPEGGGYLIPRQGHPQVNLPEWASNQVRMQTRIQPQLPNDGILSQSWFPGQHQVRGVWSDSNGTSIPSQSIVNQTDQSLYGVLSQCNQLRPDRHFDSVSPTEQFMLPRNYAMMSAGAPRISNALPQAPHPLGFLGVHHDTGGSLVPGDMAWMNVSQSSTPQDPLGKPFLRSWNQ